MDDIFAKLKQLEAEVESDKLFVYYDPKTCRVVHIRNYVEYDEYPFIEIKRTEVDEHDNIFQLAVIEENNKKKVVRLKDLKQSFSVNKVIFKIPEHDDGSDIVVVQDNKRGKFILEISKKTVDLLLLSNYYNLVLYVTTKNDPNILYQNISIDLTKGVKGGRIEFPFEKYVGSEPHSVYSIYSNFDYSYTVIDGE